MRNAREIKVGLTVLAAIVLLYLAFAWTKRMHFFAPEERSFEVRFDNVNGLLEGDPVTVRGYTAGRVVSILPRSSDVQVIVTVDSRIPLFQEASAEIQVKELMGGKQIAILPGSSEPQLPSGSVFERQYQPRFFLFLCSVWRIEWESRYDTVPITPPSSRYFLFHSPFP